MTTNKIFNKKFFIFTFFLLIILYIFPTPPKILYDAVTLEKINNFWLHKNLLSIILTPFIDIPDYFLSLIDFRSQLISWVLWLEFFTLLLSIKKLKQFPLNFLKTLLLFFLLASYVLFIRYPGNKLTTDMKNVAIVDYQSHTCYSWDAFASINRSINFHKNNGYNAYAITEHDLMLTDFLSIDELQKKYKNLPFIFFGTEIYDSTGVHYGIFGIPRTLKPMQYYRHYPDIRKLIDQYNGVSMGIFWWRHQPINEILLSKKMEAAEIFNMGHPDIPEQERLDSINLHQQNKLTLVGSTDWHGWGYQASVWTIAFIPNWDTLPENEKQIALIDVLKGKYETQIIRYARKNEIQNKKRFIFEPFYGIFYYFSSIDLIKLFSWLFWINIFYAFITFFNKNKKTFILWSIYSIFAFVLSIMYILAWIPVSFNNTGLREVSAYTFVIFILTFIVTKIEYKKNKS